MTPVLVDSNVILDVATTDPRWAEWSERTLKEVANAAPLVINPLIFAEVSACFEKIEDVDSVLPVESFRREELPYAAAFLAGKCFVRYRRAGGHRRSPLPDFYIGAHAAVAGYRLLTRDSRRYRSYFPTVRLIAPNG